MVRRHLMSLHSGKAAGPDGVLPRVLKACAPQLCGVLSQVFSLSLDLQRVPVLWKTSFLVPVPKMQRPSGPQDYRPVALTSRIMKTLERLVLKQLMPMVRPFTDPLQFTYLSHLGVEDGIIYLLNRVFSLLDKPASTVRVMFFDFSSAFNTIRLALLGEKIATMQLKAPIISRIVDFLMGRPQYVRIQNCTSDRVRNVVGEDLETLTTVAERRMLSRLQSILDNVSYPLYDTLAQLKSTFSGRLLSPRCTTESLRKSFLPVVIKLYNASLRKSDTFSL